MTGDFVHTPLPELLKAFLTEKKNNRPTQNRTSKFCTSRWRRDLEVLKAVLQSQRTPDAHIVVVFYKTNITVVIAQTCGQGFAGLVGLPAWPSWCYLVFIWLASWSPNLTNTPNPSKPSKQISLAQAWTPANYGNLDLFLFLAFFYE